MSKLYEGVNPFKVGDILHHQYYYRLIKEESFPEFYLVTRISTHCVWVKQIGRKTIATIDRFGMSGLDVPDEANVWSKEKRCPLHVSYLGIGALIDDLRKNVAIKWDGKPKEFLGC